MSTAWSDRYIAVLGFIGWMIYAWPTAYLLARERTLAQGLWIVLLWGGSVSVACFIAMWRGRK